MVCNCGLREHIQKMIDKCKKEKLEIEKDPESDHPTFFGITEERYDHLDNLQSTLQFILDYPDREQTV